MDRKNFDRKNGARPGQSKYGNARGNMVKKPPKADARKVALNALSDVIQSKAYAAQALNAQLQKADMPPEDKRLATRIFYAALENKIQIDYVIARFLERVPEPFVADVLRIAAAQILFTDKLPDHAIVDEAVKQAKRAGREGFAGLINATIRNIIRARDAGELTLPDKAADPLLHLSVKHSMPVHLISRLIDQYGEEFAEAMIAYKPDERAETLRCNLTRMTPDAFYDYANRRGWKWEKAQAPGAIRVVSAGNIVGDPDYRKGLYSIQGIGSMVAAMALEPKPAGTYLDACAAPGGKTALIAEHMQGTGRVQAWDIYPHRVELIQAMKERLGLDNVRAMERDAKTPRPEIHQTFDGVLIDAPCSGLGVAVNKPDIKYRVTDGDIASIIVLQKEILDACAEYVAPGGLLVYSTCTVLREENEDQVEAFLLRHPEFEPDENYGYLPESFRQYAQGGCVQLHAHRDDAEGFFIARLRRRRN